MTQETSRSDPLWAAIFNAIPSTTSDGGLMDGHPDQRGRPDSLRSLARKLCGCAENMQGGCPRPGANCMERAQAFRVAKAREARRAG